MRRSRTLAAALLLMLAASAAGAVNLAIDYPVLERAIQEEEFTQQALEVLREELQAAA